MAKFMAIYTGTPGAKPPLDQATARHAGQIVDHGGPLGKTKRITAEGVSDTSNAIAAYVVVEAEDHAAAARMFEGHPHFAIFPGDGVEVMPLLPIPGR